MPRSNAPDAPAHDRAALLRLAASLLGSREAAEDVVQEALLRHVERFAGDGHAAVPDDPGAWLARVTRNLAVDRLRRARREREARRRGRLDDPREEPERPDDDVERRERRRAAIDALLGGGEPRDVAAVLLRETFGTPYADIARGSGRDVAAWRQAVHRTLERARWRDAPAVVTEADAVRERFDRAVAERDARPLFDALRVEALGARASAAPATATIRFALDARGARVLLVLGERVLCRVIAPREGRARRGTALVAKSTR